MDLVVLLASAVAVVVDWGTRLDDGRAADLLSAPKAAGELRLRTPRRRIPLPPVGVGLAATAVLLETAGFIGRLTGVTGPVARALSMDAPYSAPRTRSEEHTSELQSRQYLVCRLLLEKKK